MTDSKRQTHNMDDQSVKTPIVAAERPTPIGLTNDQKPDDTLGYIILLILQ